MYTKMATCNMPFSTHFVVYWLGAITRRHQELLPTTRYREPRTFGAFLNLIENVPARISQITSNARPWGQS
eukprot:COSAG06_NODE_7517_length_2474_cov_1.968842_2_plen_71_part_00